MRTCVPSEQFARRTLIRKTSLSSDRSDGVRSSSRHKTLPPHAPCGACCGQCSEIACRNATAVLCGRLSRSALGAILPLHDVRYHASASTSGKARLMVRQRKRNDFLCERASPDWWSQTGSNRRPPACKAGALPTELWPRISFRYRLRNLRDPTRRMRIRWWAWEDLNFRPHAYQARALTN
jgi:hypothetical protein